MLNDNQNSQAWAEIRKKNLAKQKQKNDKLLAKSAKKDQKQADKIAKQKQYQKQVLKTKNQKLERKINVATKTFDTKIAHLETLKAQISEEEIAREKAKIDRSLIKKYYLYRQERAKKGFDRKVKKINYEEQIAKISKKQAKNKIAKLKVDYQSLLEHYDYKILKLNNCIKTNKYKHKIATLKNHKAKQIANFKEQLQSVAPYNFLTHIRDYWRSFVAISIKGKSLSEYSALISEHLRKYSMFYILGLIIFIFGAQTDWKNLNANQFMNIIQGNAHILIIGMGMLLVIVAGYIDLSVGALMGFMGALSVKIFNQLGGNIIVTLILVILIGVMIGLFQGILIGYFKMPAFIVTLGSMLLFQGLILTITASKTLAPITNGSGDSSYVDAILGTIPEVKIGSINLISMLVVLFIGALTILFLFLGRSKKIKYGIYKESFITFGLKILFVAALFSVLAYYVAVSYFGLKYYLLYIIILIAIFIFITQNTSFGRNVYAMGGNQKAARLSGINCELTTTYIFMIVGGIVGFASIVFTGIVTNAGPLVASAGYELDVISSVFVGGASMNGGIGTITGTFIGGLILGYINNGMFLLNFQADMQKIVKAIVLLLAVGYDIYSNRKIS